MTPDELEAALAWLKSIEVWSVPPIGFHRLADMHIDALRTIALRQKFEGHDCRIRAKEGSCGCDGIPRSWEVEDREATVLARLVAALKAWDKKEEDA